MYCSTNFKTKKALKAAVASGHLLTIYQPGPFGTGPLRESGTFSVEGPHYPEPHRWYARVTLGPDGYITKVS